MIIHSQLLRVPQCYKADIYCNPFEVLDCHLSLLPLLSFSKLFSYLPYGHGHMYCLLNTKSTFKLTNVYIFVEAKLGMIWVMACLMLHCTFFLGTLGLRCHQSLKKKINCFSTRKSNILPVKNKICIQLLVAPCSCVFRKLDITEASQNYSPVYWNLPWKHHSFKVK